MISARATRRWATVHTWSSLISTVFMLLLCVTGLPLIFHHENGHLLGTEVEAPDLPEAMPMADLDRVLDTARARHPGKNPMFASREEDDDRIWYVTLSDTPTSEVDLKQVAVDARTATALAEPRLDGGFIYIMHKLHVDLFAGLPGTLLLGVMGLLLAVAIVSGVVLYGPFTRKLAFGTVRHERSRWTRWLDLHNLLGITTLAWAMVVTLTGVINTLADPVIKLWQFDQVAKMIAPYQGQPPPQAFGSADAALKAAVAREPDMKIGFIAFPGTTFSSPHHYTIFMRGDSPLTSRLFKPVLVDAQTAQVTDSRDLPWYVAGLLVSQPLHFGDYGGLPMQILWALLDIVTIIVLGSGLYLWISRHLRARAAARPGPASTGRTAPLGTQARR